MRTITDLSEKNAGELPYLELLSKSVRSLRWTQYDSWETHHNMHEKALDLIPGKLLRVTGSRSGLSVLVETEEVLAAVGVEGYGHLTVTAGTKGGQESLVPVLAYIHQLRELFPEPPAIEGYVPMRFWALTRRGPQLYRRRLQAPTWDEIMKNYAAKTQGLLNQAMQFQPQSSGSLVLWSGEAGTGKTWALRALAQAWSDWCHFEVIIDPEEFFGHAEYLIESLMESIAQDEPSSDDDKTAQKWRLFVFEDSGEIIAKDARAQTGQGLSRFLNLADGLIGQGLRVLLLVTTNEELKSFHPAVARPGRCAIYIPFERLSLYEANAWLAQHEWPGNPPQMGSKTSLAELYAKVGGYSGAGNLLPTELFPATKADGRPEPR